MGLWDMWSEVPNLVLLEPTLGAKLGLNDELVGFPIDRAALTQVDPSITEFISSEDGPLVIVCQGTLLGKLRPEVNNVVVDAAVDRLGAKALVLGSAKDWGRPEVLSHPYIPLENVLPHATCIAHHGGAGTLRHTRMSGVSSLICPGPFDTQWNVANLLTAGTRTWAAMDVDTPVDTTASLLGDLIDVKTRPSGAGDLDTGSTAVDHIMRLLSE